MYKQLEFYLKIIKIKPLLINSVRKSHITKKQNFIHCKWFYKIITGVGPTLIASKDIFINQINSENPVGFLWSSQRRGAGH